MAQKLTATIPPDLDLAEFYTIRFTALDPNTGDEVAGVNVSGCQIIASNIANTAGDALAAGPFMLIPGATTS